MIYINGRFLSQRLTGIQRFAYEICCALHQIGVSYTILAPANIRDEYDLTDLSVEIIGGKGSHFWEQVTLPRYMKRHYDGHILLSLSGLSPLCYNRNLFTIHDISYLLKPRAYSLLYCLYYRIMTPIAAKNACKILTVSKFSKDEIMRYIGVLEDKIVVVYNAVRPTALLPRQKKERYLLAVGSLMPRKNIKRLLDAYCSIEQPDFDLYIAGGMHSAFADTEWSAYNSRKGVRFLGYVNADELTNLYRNATAYINPSLYEGFGIPLVEAMAQECAMAVSDIPVFHEVGGNAALYFNPLDLSDIQEKMNAIMHDEHLREQLIKEGKIQVGRFSWEQSAKIIQKLVNDL